MYKPHLPAQPIRFIIFPNTPLAAVWSRKSPSVFDIRRGICYNKSTKGILPIDGQPKLKILTRK